MTYTEKRKAVRAAGKLFGEELFTDAVIAQLPESTLDMILNHCANLLYDTEKALVDKSASKETDR